MSTAAIADVLRSISRADNVSPFARAAHLGGIKKAHMPEGHTIHRLARDLNNAFAGQSVTSSSPQGRFSAEAKALDGHVFAGAEAYGKHLLIRFDTAKPGHDVVVHVHLGLFGRFRKATKRAGQIRWQIASATQCYQLSGPTACELLSPSGVEALLARLGPDLLRTDAKPAKAFKAMTASRRPLGALLLDQSVLCGVGNVYRAEALYLCGLHPAIRGVDLTPHDFRRLWKCLVALLKAGVKDRRIDTVGHSTGAKSNRGERTYVYKQKNCRRCNEAVEVLTMAGRNIYLCETCQRR